MSKRVLCKFFVHGACLKGDHCEFSHDWNAPANNVCTFYQKGVCTYGSRCRYDHVKGSQSQFLNGSSSVNSFQSAGSDSVTVTRPSSTTSGVSRTVPVAALNLSDSSKPLFSAEKVAWDQISGMQSLVDTDNIVELNSLNSADQPICSFAAAGNCPRGETCPHIHGDLCSFCGKHCLHPFRTQEREEHLSACQKKQKHLDALKHSQEIECSVCLERVLSKLTAAERKFGLLSECDHPFCISCIRDWRSSSPSSGMDVNSTLRACPICRQVSFFVIPSVIWYFSQEEKMEIVDNYKAKLRSIDCKHFDFGNGICPFGTSCFYKHKVKPGSHLWNRYHMPGSSYDGAIECMHVLFDYLYKPHHAVGLQELENYGYDDTESEDYDELDYDAYTDIGAEMYCQMMEDVAENVEHEDSFADYLADRYCMMEMQAFLSSMSSDQD